MPAQTLVLAREPVDLDGVEGAQDGRGADVEAELERTAAHLDLFAEDREIGDASGKDARGGTQDAVVAALGQDDVLAVRARALHEAVLEHEGRHDGRAREAERPDERLGVDVALEEGEGRVVAPLRIRRQPAARRHDLHDRVVGRQVGRDDRERAAEPVDETVDVFRQGEGTVQDDARDGGEGARALREKGGEQHLDPVGRDDDEGAVDEARQDVDDGHARDYDLEDLARQHLGVALEQLAAHAAHDVADRRRDEGLVFGEGPHADGAVDRRTLGCRGRVDDGANGTDRVDERLGVGAIDDNPEQPARARARAPRARALRSARSPPMCAQPRSRAARPAPVAR